MKIRLAFYKVQDKDPWGWLIATYTQIWNPETPKYCHAEIGIPSGDSWLWYSSASRNWDGTTGTRWIEQWRLFKNLDCWDIYELDEVRPVQDMIQTCEAEKGLAYDWYGIAGFLTPFGQLNSKKQWYCSEICHYVFFGVWKKRISPVGLFAELKRITNIRRVPNVAFLEEAKTR